MEKVRARDIMSAPVIAVRPATKVAEAVREMRRHGISGLPITEGSRLVGIITESDILAKEVGLGGLPELDYLAPRKRVRARLRHEAYRVRELMTDDVVTAEETSSVREVARLMIRHGFNHIPVVRDDELVGIVTRSDVIAVFDRPARAVLADVRRALREDVRINPDRFDIVVNDGVVSIAGSVDNAYDISLIDTIVTEIDGVAGLDTSGITASGSVPA